MAPRKQSRVHIPEKTLIIDNGAYTIKAGYAPSSLSSLSAEVDPSLCHTIPNCIAKLPSSKQVYVGSQLSQCRDFAEMVFRRPVQRGHLVNWESEREIWAASFFDTNSSSPSKAEALVVPCENPQDTSLILTESPNTLNILQSNTDQVIFEEFEFAAYRRVAAPVAAAYVDIAGLFEDYGHQKKDTKTTSALLDLSSSTTATSTHSIKPLGKGLATTECVLVVDVGHSHTTITPVYQGRAIQQAVRCIDVGGKFITNFLKESLSIRQLDLSHEFHIVNEMKEDACFVTSDLRGDLERTWKQGSKYEPRPSQSDTPSDSDGSGDVMDTYSPAQDSPEDPYAKGIVLDYVLPDYTSRFRGESRPHDPLAGRMQAKIRQMGAAPAATQDTVVTLGNERFAGPELLFNPRDVGLQQAGLAEAVMQSVRATPPGLWGALLGNVLVVGGTSRLSGLVDRLYADLRPLVPVEINLRVKRARNPETAVWDGAARLTVGARGKGLFKDLFVTRQEYMEYGEQWLMRQFAGGKPLPW